MSGPFREESDPNLAEQHEEFRSWLSDRLCPVCRTQLYGARRKKVQLEACGGCGGVWLAGEDAKHLLATRDGSYALIAAAAVEGSEKRTPTKDARHCPDCQQRLREGHMKMGDINVDICDQHGTWFDAHELSALVTKLNTRQAEIDNERPIELETPFVQLVRKVFDAIKKRSL